MSVDAETRADVRWLAENAWAFGHLNHREALDLLAALDAAEERALRAEAEVRALREAQGELLDVIYEGDHPLCPTCHDVIECFGCRT